MARKKVKIGEVVRVEWLDARSIKASSLREFLNTHLIEVVTIGRLVRQTDDEIHLLQEKPIDPEEEISNAYEGCVLPAGWVRRIDRC